VRIFSREAAELPLMPSVVLKPLLRLCAIACLVLLAGCVTPPEPAPPPTVPAGRPKIALALGGGAARGFAHVGVIKVLEAQGIIPDIVVGTSAGSVVAALYAGGGTGFDLQRLALGMEDSSISDWILPDRGIIRGEALQNYVNIALGNRPMEKLPRTLGIVATDLQSGEMIVFRRGNVGMAVRASSSVPGIFQPVRIGNREYVDGGLVSPVPAKVARDLGADVVIAVDISSKPTNAKVSGIIDVLLQTFTIMGAKLAQWELTRADVVIRPNVAGIAGTDFESKHLAILEGERAAAEKIAEIRSALSRPGGAPATAP
jgi:NTE family protein